MVQESLTNVVRHARPAHAVVDVEVGVGAVGVRVSDDGAAAATERRPGGGRGLGSMRERVAGLGGRVEAGRTPGAGWCVTATIPWPERKGPAYSAYSWPTTRT
ncbi:sensor histidine kinase [Streptomyces sp. NPDC051677]|uniref:sensor histidine kinase n=1 Tax=Streptomyces sp. NPDC051677 TaxID=3365669 RepID=UPI0037D9111A